MRRLRSALAVGAVAVVAVVAAVDGIRGGDRTLEPRSTRAGPAHIAPTAESVSGTLIYLDRRCRLHRIALPSGADSSAPRRVACGLALDPAGRLVNDGETWQPGGALFARCTGGHVTVHAPGGEPILRRRGCSPAWKPDGSLTYVVDGSLRLSSELRDRRLLSAGDVSHALGLASATIGPTSLREVAWLDDRRFATLLATNRPPGPEGLDLLVIFEGRRPVRGATFLAPRLSGLVGEPSREPPRGSDGTWAPGGAHLPRPKREPVQPRVRERPCDRLVARRALGCRGHAAEHPALPGDRAIPTRPPVCDPRDGHRVGALNDYRGMFPCLRGGRRSRLVRAVASASQRMGRLRLGSITSSTYPRSAAV